MIAFENARLETLPKTLDAAVDFVLDRMTAEQKELVRSTEFEKLIRFHFPWGMQIRNMLRLWNVNAGLVEACGTRHPDDTSHVIIESLWKRLQSCGN
ncbi:hypothetical protein BH11PLA2_BH11PLA2_42520 [soil metagenome]